MKSAKRKGTRRSPWSLSTIQREHIVLLWEAGEGMQRLARMYRVPLRQVEALMRRQAR